MVLMINRGLLYTPVGQLECQTGISFCKAVVPQQRIWHSNSPPVCWSLIHHEHLFSMGSYSLPNDTIQSGGRQLVYNDPIYLMSHSKLWNDG